MVRPETLEVARQKPLLIGGGKLIEMPAARLPARPYPLLNHP